MKKHAHWIAVGALFVTVAAYVVFRSWTEAPPRAQLPPPPPAPPAVPAPAPAPLPASAKSLKFTPEAVEFGEAAIGQTIYKSVKVQNLTDKPIHVFRILSGCPCISAQLDAPTIPPKGVAEMVASFTGVPGKRVYKTPLSVVTDESGPSRYEVPSVGSIRQDFVVEHETLLFGRMKRGESRTAETTVRRKDGSAFEITDVKARPDFQAVWTPVEEGKKTAWKLSFTAKPASAGSLTEEAVVVTDGAAEASPVVTLSAEVESDVLCDPAAVVIFPSPAGKVEFQVTLRPRVSGTKIEAQSVRETRDVALEFSSEAAVDGVCVLKVTFSDGIPPGAPFGEILISTSAQPEPIHLPYRIEGGGSSTKDP